MCNNNSNDSRAVVFTIVPPLRSISARRILQTPMGARQTSLLLEGRGQFLYSMENFRKQIHTFSYSKPL